MSPWLRKNVINEEFMNEIKRLKANGCHVKIIFGYKNGNKNVNGPDEIANELMKKLIMVKKKRKIKLEL